MKIIGLTGGIASGKSTAGRMIRAAGVDVIDADVLAREVVLPQTRALKAIVDEFGAGVVGADGALDRKALGAIVFGDDDARRRLNAIVHPAIAMLAQEKLAALRDAGKGVVVYEAPLLFENKLEGMCDATILVAVPDGVQLARVMARDQLDAAAARARIASQMPQDEKRKRATHVVDNDADLATLAARLSVAFSAAVGAPFVLVPQAS